MSDGNLAIDEAGMFRVFLVVALAALPVVVLGLVVDPVAAVILLGFEVGIGIGLMVRRLHEVRARRAVSDPSQDPIS